LHCASPTNCNPFPPKLSKKKSNHIFKKFDNFEQQKRWRERERERKREREREKERERRRERERERERDIPVLRDLNRVEHN
jgi:hypothetical protein